MMLNLPLRTFTFDCAVLICTSLILDQLVLPYLLQNHVHSKYFGPSDRQIEEFIIKRSLSREKAAEAYFAKLDPHESLSLHERRNSEKKLQLMIVVITNKRNKVDYLMQNLHEIDEQVKALPDAKIGISVCNINYKPEEHLQAVNMSRFVPVHHISQDKRTHHCCLPDKDCPDKSKVKEIADYGECIKMAFDNYKFKYLLVLEDDVRPNPGGLKRIVDLSKHTLTKMRYDWILTKLFYSAGYRGYEQTIYSVTELILFTGVLTFGFAYVYINFLRGRWTLALWMKFFLWIVVHLLLIGFCLAIGRQYVILRPLTLVTQYNILDAPGAFTQAVLYPAKKQLQILDIVGPLINCSGGVIDLLMADLIHKQHEKDIWIDYNFFEHVGFHSSLNFKPSTKSIREFFGQYLYYYPLL